ncbi:MAG: hypothetical protein ACRDZ2_07325 [Ilumatobacteraceae bacterium]
MTAIAHRHADGTVHHDHGHDDDHDHGPLESITHVQGGAAAVDIGGDVGALSVLVDGSTVGTELFVRSADDPAVSIHTGVWWRKLGKGNDRTQVAAALFCELTEGQWWVLDGSGADLCAVDITGGAVTDLDLRT